MPMEMQNQVMGYDRTATMFSPDGHLLQVEYAEKTVRLGSASIGIVCKDGIVMVADRRVKDKLIVSSSANKIFEVDDHIAITAAGILSDARILTERAQVFAQQHRVTYDQEADVEGLVREISDLKQAFSQYGGARPFGVSIMMGGVSKDKPRLFVSDVTGNYFSYKASAIGENDEKIKEMLREEYTDSITIDEGLKLSFKLFKKILGKNFEAERFDAVTIEIDSEKLKKLSEEEIKKYSK